METLINNEPKKNINGENINKKAHSFKYLIIGVILLISLFSLLLILFLSNSHNNANKNQKNLSSYEKVLLEQEKKNISFKPSIEPVLKREARGKYTLHLIYSKPSSMSVELITPLLSVLTSEKKEAERICSQSSCYSALSTEYLNTYLSKEFSKYKIHDFSLNIINHQIITINSLSKAGDIGYLWGKDPYIITKIKDGFNSSLKENNIKIARNDLVAFLYFDDSYDYIPDDNDRFYDRKKFRSFADYQYGRTYIDVYNFSPSFSATIIKILAHETLHLFGATDKYSDNPEKKECSEKGLGEPNKTPLYPQATGDIMCLSIEIADGYFKPGSFINHELVINPITAKEIGWKN